MLDTAPGVPLTESAQLWKAGHSFALLVVLEFLGQKPPTVVDCVSPVTFPLR